MRAVPIPLENRLARQASASFVGREEELGRLLEVLDDNGPVVVHLYGTAGVGKSTLLSAFAEHVRGQGATVLLMDCRLIEPTERGFLNELGVLTGSRVECLQDAVSVLSQLTRPIILGLDHYETFLLMDTWLRQTLLPALPDSFRLVSAGRQPPVPLWLTSPRWLGLFRTMAVEPLSQDAAISLLELSGLQAVDAERLAAMTHGNPLAIKLAAAAALPHRSLTLEDAAIQEVMQELTARNLADVEDPDTREAVQLASVARRLTRSLLRALAISPEEHWDQLRRLPFIDSRRDGLHIHDAVREAIARTLRASDPERYLACRRKTWRQLREELRSAPRSELWRYTADMLYLVENPVVREAFFPSGRQELAVEQALPSDAEAIHELAVYHEGTTAVAILDHWLQLQPQAFRVVRNREGSVIGFYCMCEAHNLADELPDRDPLVAAWCRHLHQQPAPASSRTLFLRRWLGREAGEAPSQVQAATWLDIKRIYMELRPELRRVYLTVVDLATYAPVATKLGFKPIEEATIELDGRFYLTGMLDFGPASVDAWLTRLVAEELGVGERSILDHDRRALTLSGESIPLTPLEFKLVELLESRTGATTTRDQILDQVWGNACADSSSNVVDAVVKSLRRKLGAEGGRIETVRGFGYRWQAE
jgi:hypothetical protein